MSSMMRILLFGKLQIQRNEQALNALSAHKLEELFCYLLLQRNHCHPREILADLFWGDNSTALSKKYLRKALWQLQAILEEQATPVAASILLVEPDWVQLNPQADVWIDVAAFEEVYTQTQGVPVQTLDCQQVQNLHNAVGLYGGDLLEGWYQDWCLYERERFRYMYLAMLDKLMNSCELRHDYDAGVVYGMRILSCDRAQERAHRQLMRLHYLAGDRTAALRQYERCRAALQAELGVPPAQATEEIYQQIRADHLTEQSITPMLESQARALTITYTPPLLAHLKQFQIELTATQHWVQQHIEDMELALHSQC